MESLERTHGRQDLKVFNELSEFYKSNEWRKLLSVLKMERMDDNGQIICEYCGKPIVRAYDIIGHHKEELTEENVNDFSISLNPENIAFVHHRCHNFIHNKFGYKVKEIYLVYGAPLSGKREWVSENMNEGDLVIDIDDIWQCVSGCARYVKPNRLKSVVFRVRDTLMDCVKYRNGKWNNVYIVGGFPLSSERERICKEYGAREVFIEVTKEECIERLNAMEMPDKESWMNYIGEWFERYERNF